MDLQSKECSGVNIVTKNLRRMFDHLHRIFDFTKSAFLRRIKTSSIGKIPELVRTPNLQQQIYFAARLSNQIRRLGHPQRRAVAGGKQAQEVGTTYFWGKMSSPAQYKLEGHRLQDPWLQRIN